MKGERVNESQTNLSSAMPKRERESILKKTERGRGGSLSDAQFLRDKRNQAALKYNFLCFTILATCAIVHRCEAGRQNEHNTPTRDCHVLEQKC